MFPVNLLLPMSKLIKLEIFDKDVRMAPDNAKCEQIGYQAQL